MHFGKVTGCNEEKELAVEKYLETGRTLRKLCSVLGKR